jgi:ribosomal protein S27AE
VDKPIELVPLLCPRCSTAVPAEVEEVAWVCGQCGQGILLYEGRDLVPLEVNFSAEIAPNTRGKPFWVADGQVTLQRETYGSGSKQTDEAESFWSQPRRFLIPAYSCTLEEMLTVGTKLLLQPPAMRPGAAVSFEPVTLPFDNVVSAAEFIVMAIEAGRKDKLKRVDFQLRFSTSPILWVLP